MKTAQKKWTQDGGWQVLTSLPSGVLPQLVLAFGGVDALRNEGLLTEVRQWYPEARVVFCSTAGEILGTTVMDNSLAVTALAFENTELSFSQTTVETADESEAAGVRLAQGLPTDGLVHALVFSDGLKVNGTALVKGITGVLPKTVSVTGGLVGDGGAFKETLVGLDENPKSGNLVLIGLYGQALRVGYGSLGGWDPFGPDRKVTKSKGNVLYELDGKPALTLYKEYLGQDLIGGLPGSGLLFPLNMMEETEKGKVELVRTLLGTDEAAQSMTFAGDIPEGRTVKLMHANFDRLVDGAAKAAGMSTESLGEGKAEFALLVSCIGRKLVLKERIEDETEAVAERIGSQAAFTGFYSYGEICPTAVTGRQCQLHNQTMTITTFREEHVA